MGGSAVEITIEGKVDTMIAFKLENFEIHGHRLPSFLPPTGGIIRLPEHISRMDDRTVTPRRDEAAGSSIQTTQSQTSRYRQRKFNRYRNQIQDAASHGAISNDGAIFHKSSG
jgi:hypothetical protein